MAKTPTGPAVEPSIKAMIGGEVDRALQKLGAEIPRTDGNEATALHDVLRKHGAKSDLLGIVAHWRDEGDDQWALNELRRWNTRGGSFVDATGRTAGACVAGTQDHLQHSHDMAAHHFSSPVLVDALSGGKVQPIDSVEAAYEHLIHNWPAASVHKPRHRDAIDASLKVMDGHRSTIDAENAFIAAAREAEILVAPADERPLRN